MSGINNLSSWFGSSWERLIHDLERGKSLYDELKTHYIRTRDFDFERFICDLTEALNHKDQIHLKTIKLFPSMFSSDNILPTVNIINNLALKIVMHSDPVYEVEVKGIRGFAYAFPVIDALFESSVQFHQDTLQKLVDSDPAIRAFVLATFKLIPSAYSFSKAYIEGAISLYENTNSFEEKRKIFDVLVNIQTEERGNIIYTVAGTTIKDLDFIDKMIVLSALEEIPWQERTQKCVENLILLNSVKRPVTGYKIDRQDKADVFEWSANIVRQFPDAPILKKGLVHIIMFISKLNREERKELIPRLYPYLPKFITEWSIDRFLDIILLIDPREKTKITDVSINSIIEISSDGFARKFLDIFHESKIKKTAAFLQGMLDICKIKDGFPSVEKMKEFLSNLNDPEDTIEKAGPLLKEIKNFETKFAVLWFVSLIDPQHRTPEIIQKISIFWDKYTEIYLLSGLNSPIVGRRTELAGLLRDIPLKERADIIEKVVPYLTHFTTFGQIYNFFKIVIDTPKEERTVLNLDNVIAIHLAGIAIGELNNLLNVYNLSPSERMDVIARILPYLGYFKSTYRLNSFMRGLGTIPKENRQSLLEFVQSHLQEDTDNIGWIIQILGIFPVQERTDRLVRALRVLFKGISGVQGIKEILTNLPETERVDLIEKTNAIIKKLSIKDGFREAVLEIVALLPPPDRKSEIIRAIPSLFFAKDSEQAMQKICTCIKDVPEERRAQAIIQGRSFLCDNIDLRTAILYACGSKQGAEVFQNSPGEFDNIVHRDDRILGQLFLTFIPPECHTKLVIEAIVKCFDEPEQTPKMVQALVLFCLLPKESHSAKTVYYLTQALAQEHISLKNQLFSYFTLIPRDALIEVEELILDEMKDGQFNEGMLFSCFKVPKIREAFYENIQKALESDIPPEDKLVMARWIVEKAPELLLHEEHEVMQLAYVTISLCDPEALKNRKNPYRVYTSLKEILKTEKDIAVVMTSQVVGDLIVKIDIVKLREKGLWKGYKMKDLPSGIGRDTLDNLFKDFVARIDSLPKEEKEAAQTEIQNSCGHNLSFLITNLTNPFIKGLLSRTNNPEEKVMSTQFQLFALLRAVLDADGTVASGEKLSKREYFLLKVSESIQNCNTGQRDNLANYYNALPEKYKKGPRAEDAKEADVVSFVDDCIQKVLNGILTNEAFLTEITSGEGMSQAAHITEFLRNRFHRQIGLKHQLTFDQYTGVLALKLLEAQPEQILTGFFQYCIPSTVVQQIISGSEDMLKANKFMGLDAVIKRSEGPTADYNQFFVFEEETMTPLRLTERGAAALLKSVGYFI